MITDLFHPAVARWFQNTFPQATEVQLQAWPVIQQQQHTLIAAPTGSGKTLAAFLAAINELVEQGLQRQLEDKTTILYVSPLKALSNDIHKNLQVPLAGIADELLNDGQPNVEIRAQVRTGDTPQSERERMRRVNPHILVTTPESLFILLTSESGRDMLSTVRTVIVDEIHSIATSKRGSHLALSLQRLEALCSQPLTRIGLSATQRPVEEMAHFLTGVTEDPCEIVDCGHVKERELSIELPPSPMTAVMSGETWQEVYARLEELIEQHETTLIFVNTRRLAERAARFLGERIGEENVTAHHGSLAKEHRLDAEQRLKEGKLKALVATASLELGIDIGHIDLVVQIGSPKSIAALLQRVGRSGHAVGAIPKGILIPQSRDDLIECAALLDAVQRNELDLLKIPNGHLDVLSQHLIAEVAASEWQQDSLYIQFTRAWPYRDMDEKSFSDVIHMLAEGFSTKRGRRSQYIHYDAVNKKLTGRKGARLTAVTNAGAIPDQFDYDVILEPESLFIGTLNEDFAFESLPGDIFQLGNTSYRILKVEQNKVRVQDAKGQPPNIPFWFGEAPGRSDELSHAVSRFRANINEQLEQGLEHTSQWLQQTVQLSPSAARQITEYLGAARAVFGFVPTQQDIVFERFFDDVGDQHLVIHSPYGSRVNRAWGLGLRKKFCRQFNFELQAAALEDSIVLSLGATHSFPLEEVVRYVHSNSIKETVSQAMLATPMFPTHWRWNATISLAIRRNNKGSRVPAQFQRSDAEDLMAIVFPDQIACQDNITGEREIPDHPLVQQTVDDCLHDLMDIDQLTSILQNLEENKRKVHCFDLSAPSPLAQEIINARPYAFLDDAPAEERRTNAISSNGYLDPTTAADIAQLNPDAIQTVCEQVWPEVATAEELHEALLLLGAMTESEIENGYPENQSSFPQCDVVPECSSRGPESTQFLKELKQLNRVTKVTQDEKHWYVCAERLPQFKALHTKAITNPEIKPAGKAAEQDWDTIDALTELIRGRLEGIGPITATQLAYFFYCEERYVQQALLALENEGFVMQGKYTPDANDTQWCNRATLARMHRYTIRSLRAEISPVSPADYMRSLFAWHGMVERPEGEVALEAAIARLEGFPIPAAAWESDILPSRIKGYVTAQLDHLCTTGRITWTRLNPLRNKKAEDNSRTSKAGLLRNTPIALIDRYNMEFWQQSYTNSEQTIKLSSTAEKVKDTLQQQGASFFIDLVKRTGLLRTHVEEALAELAAVGLVTSDSYAGLRALIAPANKKPSYAPRNRRRRTGSRGSSIDDAGRWSLITPDEEFEEEENNTGWIQTDWDTLNHIAWVLLKRYGVVFHKVIERETNLPPWRELLYAWRRMEARGEIRGGRFVQGFSGEQFALPDAITLLKKYKDGKQELPDIVISATDPLNLVGIVLPGDRISSLHTNRILFRNGLATAKQLNGDISYYYELKSEDKWEIQYKLTKYSNPSAVKNSGRFSN